MAKTGAITAETIRDMLGLADRGRVLDLFEKVMGGEDRRGARRISSELYDRGADPLAVMQDLLEIVHFLTRVKVAPDAEGFFDGGSGEAKRAAEMAGKLSRAVADARLADAAEGPVRGARRGAPGRRLRDGADPPRLCRRSSADGQTGARSAGRRRRRAPRPAVRAAPRSRAVAARARQACARRRARSARSCPRRMPSAQPPPRCAPSKTSPRWRRPTARRC